MKSKLLQKIIAKPTSHVSRLDDHQENIEDSSMPLEPSRRKTRSPWLLTRRPLRRHSSQSGA
jgi:hypothetical protein